MFGNRRTVDRTMRRIIKMGKEKFLPIVTGHQGEPGSILTRMVLGDTPYKIEKGDKVIFSAKVIPNPMNVVSGISWRRTSRWPVPVSSKIFT